MWLLGLFNTWFLKCLKSISIVSRRTIVLSVWGLVEKNRFFAPRFLSKPRLNIIAHGSLAKLEKKNDIDFDQLFTTIRVHLSRCDNRWSAEMKRRQRIIALEFFFFSLLTSCWTIERRRKQNGIYFRNAFLTGHLSHTCHFVLCIGARNERIKVIVLGVCEEKKGI